MPNNNTSEPVPPTALPSAERIEACRTALEAAASQAGECHETAGIFGWAYGYPVPAQPGPEAERAAV
jgi:hypothetical protein